MLRAYGDSGIFGESYGEGPVRVLWLHGWARRGADFAAAATTLADAGLASVALDFPGFGASAPPARAGGARHYAELVWPVVRELSDEPLTMVGHSFGGRVAVVLAAAHPEAFDRLVLTGVPLFRPVATRRSPWAFRATRALAKRGLLSEARLEAARQKYGSRDYRAASGVIRDVLVASVNEDYADELGAIVTPTTLVWGERDDEVPPGVADRAATLLRVAPVHTILPGVGHLVPLEAPEALARAVTS